MLYDESVKGLISEGAQRIYQTRSSQIWYLENSNKICKEVELQQQFGAKIDPVKEYNIVKRLEHENIVKFTEFKETINNENRTICFITMPKYERDLTN